MSTSIIKLEYGNNSDIVPVCNIDEVLKFEKGIIKEIINDNRGELIIDDNHGSIIVSKHLLNCINNELDLDIDSNVFCKYLNIKETILDAIGLDGAYISYFDEETLEYTLISKDSKEKRFFGINSEKIDIIINNVMNLESFLSRLEYIDSILPEMSLALLTRNEQVGEGYKEYVVKSFIKKIGEKYSNCLDLETIQSVAAKLFRDNFSYINYSLAGKLQNFIEESKSHSIPRNKLIHYYLLENNNSIRGDLSDIFIKLIDYNNFEFKEHLNIGFDKIERLFNTLYKIKIDESLLKGLISNILLSDKLLMEKLEDKLKSFFIGEKEGNIAYLNDFINNNRNYFRYILYNSDNLNIDLQEIFDKKELSENSLNESKHFSMEYGYEKKVSNKTNDQKRYTDILELLKGKEFELKIIKIEINTLNDSFKNNSVFQNFIARVKSNIKEKKKELNILEKEKYNLENKKEKIGLDLDILKNEISSIENKEETYFASVNNIESKFIFDSLIKDLVIFLIERTIK